MSWFTIETRSNPRASGPIPFVSLLVLTAIATVVLPPPASAPAAVPTPTLDWHACPDAKGFECATARVPLDYAHPERASIHLAVARHRATDAAHRIGSLFFNPGGPGGAGTESLPAIVNILLPAALVRRFDIVSWDPRGVGDSTAVQCFDSAKEESRFLAGVGVAAETFPVGTAQAHRWIERYQAFGRRCGRSNGQLLGQVSTADTARDLNLLRRAVHDPTLNYLGVSYGTFLGATYANLFPRRVRALVLDGDVNPAAWTHMGSNENGEELGTWLRQRSDLGSANTLNAFLGLCGRADTAHCAFSAGSVAATTAKFEALLQRLRAAPASASVSYADLLSQTILQLYTSVPLYPGDTAHGWAALAAWMQEVWATGSARRPLRASGLLGLGAPAGAPSRPAGLGRSYAGPEQALAIFCAESPNPRTAAFWGLESLASGRSGAVGPYWSWGSEPCSSWPARAADAYDGPWNHPTAHPVLVIGNTHDPATPLHGAVAMSHLLARSRLLTVEAYGHTVLENASACADRYEVRYFTAGTLPPKGARCKQDQQPFAVAP